MKKLITLSILLTTMLSFEASAQEEVQINAYFIGMENNIYVFMDEFEEEITFTECDEIVLEKYNLSGQEVVGQFFTVTYLLFEESEFDQKIIKLVLTEPEIIDEDQE